MAERESPRGEEYAGAAQKPGSGAVAKDTPEGYGPAPSSGDRTAETNDFLAELEAIFAQAQRTEETANPNTNTDQNDPTGSHNSTGSGEVGEGGETRWEDLPLDPQHVDKLKSSGISPLTAKFRGYETVHDPCRLDGLGFATEVCHPDHAPGLLIPQLDARGSVWGYQYRPDNPRSNGKGKPIKYESQTRGEGRRRGLDVPPWCDGDIGDPKEEKWIVEGTLKADCLAERGICAISVSGVWNWRGTNGRGGKVALPDWNDVAIEKSEFVIAYDSDVVHKKPVHTAMVELANYLYYRAGNRVRYCHLPDGPDGQKWGADDYLAAGHTKQELWRLIKPDTPALRNWPNGDRDGDDKDGSDAASAERVAPPPYGSIDGAALLDEIDAYLSQYVIYPNEHARHAHALWIAHTHLMDCWESTPRFACLSPEPASGKTRALEVTEPLVPRPVHAVNVTSAYLFRKISDPAGLPTILYDEIDTVFGKGKENEEVRGLINAGHRKGAVAGRCATRGDNIVTEELPAYCAVMMAGLNDLPDTIMTRTIVARMKKRAPSETVKPWRQRVDAPIGRALGTRLADWADRCANTRKCTVPKCPLASTTATPTPGKRRLPSPTWPVATGPRLPV